MTKTFKPMLAAKAPGDLAAINYPILASPKIDGIRCVIRDGEVLSRALKPIPNVRVREALATLPHGFDGELLIEGGFNACQSFFMSQEPEENNNWWIFAFDWELGGAVPFDARLEKLTRWSEEHGHNNLYVVEHVVIENADDLRTYVAECLGDGFEGVMVRDPKGAYKWGRSTTKQGGLLKIKNFADEEAVIFAVEELMHNDNELEEDNLGHAKRSTHKENLRPGGTMGKLRVRMIGDGVEFGVGTGFTQQERDDIWKNREAVIGHTVKIKYQPDPGGRKPGQKPRIPVFLGFRHNDDTAE